MSSSPKKAKVGTAGLVEFRYKAGGFRITPDIKKVFDSDGVFVVRDLLDASEVAKVRRCVESHKAFRELSYEVPDGTGTSSTMVVWNEPGNDVTGMLARSHRVAKSCQELLGGEVYHYHSKLMMKQPQSGGKHLWHQDYGYWYNNGCLRPDMMTVFIALDPCVKENGCLQVVKGTHLCGRVEHVKNASGQVTAEQSRVDELLRHNELVYGELQPGDALFMHSNVLHTSDRNPSDMRRWALLCCYNRADNDPVYTHSHPFYTPLEMVPDSAILDCPDEQGINDKIFMEPKKGERTRVVLDP